jgi:hypothetical protein
MLALARCLAFNNCSNGVYTWPRLASKLSDRPFTLSSASTQASVVNIELTIDPCTDLQFDTSSFRLTWISVNNRQRLEARIGKHYEHHSW